MAKHTPQYSSGGKGEGRVKTLNISAELKFLSILRQWTLSVKNKDPTLVSWTSNWNDTTNHLDGRKFTTPNEGEGDNDDYYSKIGGSLF
jgi:hypothetical protein